MTFASTESVREVKDLVYGLELRIQALESVVEAQKAIIEELYAEMQIKRLTR